MLHWWRLRSKLRRNRRAGLNVIWLTSPLSLGRFDFGDVAITLQYFERTILQVKTAGFMQTDVYLVIT